LLKDKKNLAASKVEVVNHKKYRYF